MATYLRELDVLAMDCQATAPSSSNGHLLEVGWGFIRAGSAEDVIESRVVKLPDGASLPARVQRVTGLTPEELASGVSPSAVWSEIAGAARDLFRCEGVAESVSCPTIIHFSRFEEPFLRKLVGVHGETFPLRIVCTHEIARRMLPDLPRRGLRAIAGFFGHAVPEARRAGHHVAATATVWRRSVARLERDHGIRSLEQLEDWLRTPVPRSQLRRTYPMDESRRKGLPDEPGVYRMIRANGDVLYVGKATSLRQRIASYFQNSAKHPEHILEMLSQAVNIETVATGSATEAALEEVDQIKAYAPPYNKALKASDRSLSFADVSMTRFSDTPTDEHRWGPMPSSPALYALAAAGGSGRVDSPGEALAVPDRYAPSEATLARGLELFSERVASRSLAALGTSSWRERQAAEAEADDETAEPPELRLRMQYAEGAERWSPEGVAARIEELATRAAHLARRGAWLTVLSECAIEWDGGALGLEGGAVRDRGTLRRRSRPAPSFHERRAGFDLDTYDRMVVLLKEIRRLAASGRAIALHVGRQREHRLEGARLSGVLRWI